MGKNRGYESAKPLGHLISLKVKTFVVQLPDSKTRLFSQIPVGVRKRWIHLPIWMGTGGRERDAGAAGNVKGS